MPGTNAGTGQPITFQCPMWRRQPYGRRTVRHQVKLTGRKRKRSRCTRGRMTKFLREFVCLDCGHLGWSAHVDLERMERTKG